MFLRTASRSAIVRRGSTFSEEDIHSFYNLLDKRHQDNADKTVITDSENEPFRVVVTIKEIAVYGWRIFEVNVDAQQVIFSSGV
jgi:hypothetical protein